MKVVSREYKVMLDHGRFADRAVAVKRFWAELVDAAGTTTVARAKGEFDKKDKRTIVFLDTPDLTLGRSGLILRRRAEGDSIQYTLKCRSDDRYFAAGSDVSAGKGHRSKEKLEEDIAPPFRCRFSRSATVTLPDERAVRTLQAAAAFFPLLSRLRMDGRVCPADTPLAVVNNITAFERVYTGARLAFDLPDAGDQDASVALILWSNSKKGRPLAAEVSFRVKDSDERFGRDLARAARTMFARVQQLDWCRPEATTKTQFVYGGTAGASAL
jgi:hypothetical protein